MTEPGAIGDRSIAILILGVLAFNPPLLSLFGKGGFVFGIPLLYIYLFLTWVLVIVLAALNAERGRQGSRSQRRRRTPKGPDRDG